MAFAVPTHGALGGLQFHPVSGLPVGFHPVHGPVLVGGSGHPIMGGGPAFPTHPVAPIRIDPVHGGILPPVDFPVVGPGGLGPAPVFGPGGPPMQGGPAFPTGMPVMTPGGGPGGVPGMPLTGGPGGWQPGGFPAGGGITPFAG